MKFTRVTEERHAEEVIVELNKGEYIVLDTETTGLDPFNDRILSAQLQGSSGGEVYYIESPQFKSCLEQIQRPILAHKVLRRG